ncbi:MAG: HAD family hydrolase, partial [Pseudomonadota bacterium]
KFEEFATNILSTLGLADRFVRIIGGDSMGKGANGKYLSKPFPEPVIAARKVCGGGSFAFVGDSTYDVAAAKGAGVPVIIAAYGYCDKPPHELGGDAVIDSFHGLISALESL